MDNYIIKLLFVLLPLFIVSCGETQSRVQVPVGTDQALGSFVTVPAPHLGDTCGEQVSGAFSEADATQTCYVVVADTGLHYYELRDQMFSYQNTLGQQIDTLGRGYDKAKDLIALPEDNEDEIYAGEYYPRRYPSSTLSLEYLSFYQEGASEKSIALLTGIYDRQESADSALTLLKKFSPHAFVVKSDIYMGCIH
jgi:hypothetical protein